MSRSTQSRYNITTSFSVTGLTPGFTPARNETVFRAAARPRVLRYNVVYQVVLLADTKEV